MTTPWQQYPPGPPEWQQTLRLQSSAPDWAGDLRERIARLETSERYLAQRVGAHHDRLMIGDGRFSALEPRMAKIEDEGRRAIEDLTKVKELPKRLDAIEARSRAMKDILQYAAAAVVMGLALAGKISMPDALKMFGKAFGL